MSHRRPHRFEGAGDVLTRYARAAVYLGQSNKPEFILLRLANRHGLITGATGTGKTVTLQGLAEGFSDAGVPVFCADVKGDLSGVAETGVATAPGIDFDTALGNRFVRLSFAGAPADITEALERLGAWLPGA